MKLEFREKETGSVAIDFILEMIKVNNVRSGIEAIANQATFSFIANKNTDDFPAIVSKHLPQYVKKNGTTLTVSNDIQWYFAVYKDINDMCADSPYGMEEIFWASDPITCKVPSEYLDNDNDNLFTQRSTTKELVNFSGKKPESGLNATKVTSTTDALYPYNTLSGKVFVLTVVCNYKFSSAFVGSIFHGGSNSKKISGENGGKFLLWGRGIGICN